MIPLFYASGSLAVVVIVISVAMMFAPVSERVYRRLDKLGITLSVLMVSLFAVACVVGLASA